MDVILFALSALLVIGFFWAGGRAMGRWRGVSRLLAVLVVLGVAAWATKIVVDLLGDPTSHNLWPFEMVGVAGLALVVLGGIAVVRARVRHAA